MSGFWVLVRKEILEYRRTWRFLAMAGFFTALALLISIIPFIVAEVTDEPRGPDEAREVLGGFGFAVFSPNPPKDTDGRREDSGRGWVRELQGRWPGVLG